MERGSIGNYFQGFWEQAHSFGDLGSPAKKVKQKSHLKGKAFISFDFFKKHSSVTGGGGGLEKSKCIYFRANMLIWVGIGD